MDLIEYIHVQQLRPEFYFFSSIEDYIENNNNKYLHTTEAARRCMCDRPRERESKSGLPPLFFSTLPRWFRPTVSSSKPIGGCRWLFVLVVVPLSFFLSVVCVIDDRVFLSRHYASQMIAQSGKTLMYGLVCVLVWVCPCRLLMDGGSYKNTTHTKKETEMVFFSH